MKKRKKVLLISFITILALVMVSMMTNPLLRTDKSIRRYLLQITPIGTSMEDVVHAVSDRSNWTIRHIADRHGVGFDPRWPTVPTLSWLREDHIVVGEKSIRIHLGSYRFIMGVDVSGYYAFDENGELMDIFIDRVYDVI
jgi:hypothetical protein